MARVFGACCGLLVFSAMIVCGILAGNPVQVTVYRALVGLFGGYGLGCLCGWIGMFVVAEGAGGPDGDAAESADLREPAMTPPPEPPEV